MVSGKARIHNSSGLHARPASVLVRVASGFRCDIRLVSQDRNINAKNIMDVMTAGIKYGADLAITCDGEDEIKALQAVLHAINQRLGE